jgi:hypothetical protein
MKRWLQVLVAVALVSVGLLPTYAQGQLLTYGETATFKFTKPEQEVSFRFTGSEGDVIAITVETTSMPPETPSPVLELSNSRRVIASTEDDVTALFDASLVLELPADDTYSLLVRRNSYIDTDERRDFVLRLNLVPELTVDQPVEATFGTESGNHYYLVRQTGEPLMLSYEKITGTANPSIGVNPLGGDQEIRGLIEVTGSLTDVQVALPSRPDPLIITIGELSFDFNFDFDQMENRATYRLNLSEAERE